MAGKYAGQAITGTEAGGTVGGMAGAGGAGACFGGPVGAGGAVLIVGAVEITDAVMDQAYDYADGKKLDHRLHTIWVHHAYGEILGRLPDSNGLEFHVQAADDGGSHDELRRRVARSRQGLISGVFQHHLGRDASADERQAWTGALDRAGGDSPLTRRTPAGCRQATDPGC